MSRPDQSAFDLPGYRRTVEVVPGEGAVLAMLEDDIHCMAVILRHDGKRVLAIETDTHRMPWDTCPGAAAKLVETFQGQLLSDVTARRDKKQNCTHLHDLAVLAAAHAAHSAPLVYEIAASDPRDGQRILEIREGGSLLHRWIEQGGILVAPEAVAGRALMVRRDWIASQSGKDQEAARLLQWGSLVAHGRTMPEEQQSLAAQLPPNCYTFQPGRAEHANRIGDRFDFSEGSRVPLAELRAKGQLD